MTRATRRSYEDWLIGRTQESVRDMMRRCRQADDERKAAGTQDLFLNEQANGTPDKQGWRMSSAPAVEGEEK